MPFEDPLILQSIAGTPSYSARELRQLHSALYWNEGVIIGHAPAQRGAGANMSIDVAGGRAVVQGDDQSSPPQGIYITNNTGTDNVAIGAAPGSNSRIDVVYLRINDPNATGPAGQNAAYGVVAGTAAASPVAPSVPTSAIPIAQVLVAAGTAAITTAMITDRRRMARLKGRPPVGISYDFRGPESVVPSDFLLENGQAVNRLTYFELFFIIGTLYGAGDGSTTFNVPDSRGKVNVALDNMGGSDAGILTAANTLGATGGEEKHTLTTAELATHTHVQNAHNHSIDHDHGSFNLSLKEVQTNSQFGWVAGGAFNGPGPAHIMGFSDLVDTTGFGNAVARNLGIDVPAISATSGSTTATNQSTGGDGAHNNMQPYMFSNKIISAQ